MGGICTGDHNPDPEVVVPPIANQRIIQPQAQTQGLAISREEREFDDLVASIPILNQKVKDKRVLAGTFQFKRELQTNPVTLVCADRSRPGSNYFGFVNSITKLREYKGIVLKED